MIRINLLGVDRDRGRTRAAVHVGQQVMVACSLILLLTLLGIGWWYWSLGQAAGRLDAELAAAEAEIQRLESVLEQVRDFEARRAQLEQRVALIEQLRQGQSGPVHLLDQISWSLPDRLWLTALEQALDNEVTVSGQATTLTALSDFVANLEASGYFARPVEIIDSQVDPLSSGDVVRFTVRARFAPPRD